MGRESDDSELIARSLEDGEAFTAIFDRHYDRISAFLRRRVDLSTADELAAETFLVAFRERATFDLGRASARPWLFGIATNLAHHSHRGEARRLRAYARLDRAQEPAADAEAIDRTDARALRATLAEGLAGLSADERDVLLLLTWAQLSYEEIAEALGIPIGTVRSRLSRARGRMSELISASGQSPMDSEGVISRG